MSPEEDFGFVSFDDVDDNTDEFGFIPFDIEPSSDDLKPLHSRERKDLGVTELTSFPEEIEDLEQQQFQPIDGFQEQESFESPQEDFPLEGENDLDREIERNIAQQTSRMGESIIGAPGDIYSFVKGLFGGDSETILPTSKSLRDKTASLSQGYTEPKNEVEEKAGEVIQDISSFMLPGAGKYSAIRNIGIPLVANLAQEGVKYAGGEKSSVAAKIGLMVGLDLLVHKGKGARAFAGELFNESEKLIPEGATLRSSKFTKGISNLEKTLESGGSSPSTEKALKKVHEIKSRLSGNEIEVKELIDFRKKINELKSELGGFNIEMPPKLKKKAIANLDNVKKEVVTALDEYGAVHNPEFREINRSANEAYAAYESSDKIKTFLKKHATPKSPVAKTLFGLGGVVGYAKGASLAKLAPLTPALYAGYEGYKVFHQVMKSPTLRKFYGNILKGAASGNASEVSRNMKALEKELDDDQSRSG